MRRLLPYNLLVPPMLVAIYSISVANRRTSKPGLNYALSSEGHTGHRGVMHIYSNSRVMIRSECIQLLFCASVCATEYKEEYLKRGLLRPLGFKILIFSARMGGGNDDGHTMYTPGMVRNCMNIYIKGMLGKVRT